MQPKDSNATVGGLIDYATGRRCSLRAYDIARKITAAVDTGPGSAYLPTISTDGRLVFFREASGRTSIVRQTLGGQRRKALARVTGMPTSLAASGGTVAWTTARMDADGGLESLLLTRDLGERSTAIRERRIVADGSGVQLGSVRVVGTSLAYLLQRFGKDPAIADVLVVVPITGGTIREIGIPASAVSLGIAPGRPVLVATGTQPYADAGCVQTDARQPGCAIHELSGTVP